MPSRTHRYLPWLGWCTCFLLLLAAAAVSIVAAVIREPAADTVTKAIAGLFLVVVCALFPLGSFRMRTVVDDEAVTQYWITRSYRIPLGEITGLELAGGGRRWFLRVFQGEKTYEIIPCLVVGRLSDYLGPRPPAVLAEVAEDIETRLGPGRR
ncbi:MAG TPA: hypothetical protein VN408_17720 [Actinoplanes sp.]|nr:hypothetical protein [Actinoplanes sp.]